MKNLLTTVRLRLAKHQQLFLVQLALRFLTKNPRFFQKLQFMMLILGVISAVFQQMTNHQVELSPWAETLSHSIVQLSAFVTMVVAQLPNQDPEQSAGLPPYSDPPSPPLPTQFENQVHNQFVEVAI